VSPSVPEPSTARTVAFLAALAAFLLRAPFALAPGFGLDADAWLIAATAEGIAHGTGWAPSRPPGYPLSELYYALWISGGPRLCNLASAASVAVAVGLGTVLCARHGVRAPWALPLAASGVPAIAGPAASTLDHGPALALLSGALLALQTVRGRAVLPAITTGALFGLACAARPPLGVVGAALLFALLQRGGARSAVAFVAAAAPFVAAVLVPFLVRGIWPDAPHLLSPRVGLAHAAEVLTLAPLGSAGVAAVSVACVGWRRRLRHTGPSGLGWATLASFGLAAAFPLEANYLAPTALTGALWLATRVRPAAAIAACALVQLGGVVTLDADGLRAGPWRRDGWAREAQLARAHALHDTVRTLPEDCVVVVGPEFAVVRYLQRGTAPMVVAELGAAARAAYAARGVRVVDLTAAAR